jgi:MFS family permease
MASERSGLTLVQWLVCFTAALGFAFDTYELLMLPLIVRPALQELIGAAPGSPEFLMWVGRLFYIPAFAGGVFGLLGGWLTDRLGRRRVLTGSILLYAGAAFVSGFSTSVEMLLICRCLVFVGVCVEFVAAVAWLAELFDDPQRREAAIGYTQAFASIGGLLVALVNGWLAAQGTIGKLPAIPEPQWLTDLIGSLQNPSSVWRFTLMSGLLPAIPLIIVRPFLPESPKWREKKASGTLKRPTIAALFSPELRRTTILSTLLVGASYGMAFGALQQIPQMVPGLTEVKTVTAEMTPDKAKPYEQKVTAEYAKFQEVGGLIGRFVLAYLAVRLVTRRGLLACFAVPALVLLPLVFYGLSTGENVIWANLGGVRLTPLTLGVLVAGALVIGQFSFWGNYLPRVFPLHLRGTGESMAANVGGRMIGTSFAWVTTTLAATSWMPGAPGPERMAVTAAIVVGGLAVLSLLLLPWLPEPPEHEIG